MHILSVDQFDMAFLADIAARADWHMRQYQDRPSFPVSPTERYKWMFDPIECRWYPTWVAGKVLVNLFYEPSSRTSSSFHSAMVRLGGKVISINNVAYSSVAKGETLEDTIRTMACYGEVIALRHPEVGAANVAASVSDVPIINAGDGIGEHPTQALLDFVTIIQERKIDLKSITSLSNLKVTLMGDLLHGRTVKSLAKLLRKYGSHINWVSPDELRVPRDFLELKDVQTDDLHDVIADTDVLYVTRAQKERMDQSLHGITYAVTNEHMVKAKSDLVLMHPFPRTSELPTDLDNDPRSAYIRQMRYGLFTRMAVLEKVLEDA